MTTPTQLEPPWPHTRPPIDPFEDVNDDGFFVFVPAIMSVGIVFSIVTLLRDLFRWTGTRARERRTAIEAHAVVDDLVGETSADASRFGLLNRTTYLVAAVMLAGSGAYIAISSVANYLHDDGLVDHVGWLLALALVLALLLCYLGAVSLAVYRGWPTPPSWTSRALRTAPLSLNPNRLGHGPPVALTVAMLITAIITVMVTLTVVTARDVADSIDQPIVDALRDVEWLDALAPFDPFGSTVVTIAFVALIGLSSFRCRVMAIVYPAAFAISWLSIEVLQHTTDRARPSGFDGFESFPSGHMVQVVFITGLLPAALGALFSSQRLVVASRSVLVTATIATGLHRVYLAKHWPLDVLGGLGLGATVVLGAHWALEHRDWHRACPECPWSPEPGSVHWRRGVINIAPRSARRIGTVGTLLAVSAAAGLGAATIWIGLPQDPEGSGLGSAISGPLQLTLAASMAVAGLLALRWKALGACSMAIAAMGLGVFASIQYVPQLAILLTAALLIPAVLTWLSWQPTASLGSIAAVAVLTASALTSTGLGIRQVHAHYFGPSHPSSLSAPLQSAADWLWLGGVDHDSATITAGGFQPEATIELQYWEATTNDIATLTARVGEYGLARFEVEDLSPATNYNYRVVNSSAATSRTSAAGADAHFTTFDEGAQDLTIVIGACARRASNGTVFDALVSEQPDLYLALGDLHYGNLESSDPSAHIAEYARSLGQPAQAALFSSVPSAYVWDDHDFGVDNADRTSPASDAVSTAYRAAVPSYDVAADRSSSIAQAFTIGRVRFVMIDTRSHRDATTMLGARQLAWLLDELTVASASHALVVLANPTPWVGVAVAGSDTWAGYAHERERIAQTIADADITNLIMVSGDAHMVAIDDGTNTGYAADGGGGFPLLHAGALDRRGSVKGGPYSHGSFPGGGQYGRLRIDDDNSETVTARLSGHTWDGVELVSLERTFEVPLG